MKRTPRFAGALLFLLALPCAAQTVVYVPDANPAAGRPNNIPLGGKGPTGGFQNMRTQIRVPASFLPKGGVTIRDLGFAGVSNGTYSYSLLEVRLAHLKGLALSKTFADNLAGTTLVLRKANTRLTMKANAWSNLGLTGSFIHDGKRDLVVEIVIQGTFFNGRDPGSRRSSTLETVYALNYSVRSPVKSGFGPFLAGAKVCLTLNSGSSITIVGRGCPKKDNRPVVLGFSGSSKRGAKLTVTAVDAPPGATLSLLIGTSEKRFGNLVLPYDLAPIGAPGCVLRTDVLTSQTTGADTAGNAQFDLPIPNNPFLTGKTVLCQWAVPAKGANRLELVLSAMLRARIE